MAIAVLLSLPRKLVCRVYECLAPCQDALGLRGISSPQAGVPVSRSLFGTFSFSRGSVLGTVALVARSSFVHFLFFARRCFLSYRRRPTEPPGSPEPRYPSDA